MDTFYDKSAAKKSIEHLAEYMAQHQLTLKEDYCVGPAHLIETDNVCVKETGFPSSDKAVMKEDVMDQREITLTVVGVLQEMNLPAMKKANNVAYARQQATIVGLGAESFDKAVEQIAKIAYEVELAFEDSDATCRYFTTGKEPPMNQVVDFTKHVDPAGVLSRMLSKGVYHCIDNEVLYLDLEGDKLINKNPSGFRVGDIVELGLSVIAFKGPRDGKAVIKLVMRSLVFLDGTHTQDAKIAQRIAEAKAKKTSQTDVDKDMGNHKRRLVFDDQDEVGRVGSPFPFGNMVDAIHRHLLDTWPAPGREIYTTSTTHEYRHQIECVFGTEWMRSASSTYLGIEKHGSLEDTTKSAFHLACAVVRLAIGAREWRRQGGKIITGGRATGVRAALRLMGDEITELPELQKLEGYLENVLKEGLRRA
ncbi:hypothetical protein C8J57DRAFT_1464295 [Mycena rebaudengoi]|nr:hypothetical protein C8J57DRAFT_1464295 [Mycena rebaudengoi]